MKECPHFLCQGNEKCFLAQQVLHQARKGGKEDPNNPRSPAGPHWSTDAWRSFVERTRKTAKEEKCANPSAVEQAIKKAEEEEIVKLK